MGNHLFYNEKIFVSLKTDIFQLIFRFLFLMIDIIKEIPKEGYFYNILKI